MSADLIQSALKDIQAQKQDHTAGSVAYQRMERVEAALRAMVPQPQGQALPELPDAPLLGVGQDGLDIYGFTANQVQEYARAYASQLALPAGPVKPVSNTVVLRVVEEMYAAKGHVTHEQLKRWAGDLEICYAAVYEDIYDQCCKLIEPLAIAHKLPGSVVESLEVLIEHFSSPSPAPAGPVPENKHDWPEDWPQENGKYLSRCHQCYVFFTGHKRRVTCKVCASPAVAQPDNTAAWESGELGRSAEHAKPAPAEIERQVAAAVAQPVADERAEFEAFAKEKMFDLDSGQHGYTSWPTSMAWYVWQVTRKAARAALCPPAEEGDKA